MEWLLLLLLLGASNKRCPKCEPEPAPQPLPAKEETEDISGLGVFILLVVACSLIVGVIFFTKGCAMEPSITIRSPITLPEQWSPVPMEAEDERAPR